MSRIVKFLTTVGALCLVTGCGNPTTGGGAYLARSAAKGSRAYICNFGYDDQPGTSFTTLDLGSGPDGSGTTLGPPVSTGSLPSAAAATPNGRLLLVTDQGNDQLAVVDTATDAVISHIVVGVEPDAVAVSPDGKTALVANVDDDTVTPIDLTTLRAGRPIAVGSRPDAVAIGGPDGTTALVADLEGNTVTPVDLSTMTAGSPIPVGQEPEAVAISPDGTTALVADFGSDTVTPIDVATLRAGSPIAVGTGPTDLAVTATGPGGHPTAWVTTGTDLVPVDLTLRKTGAPVDVGHLAEAVAIGPDGTTAWVAGQDATVTPVDLALAPAATTAATTPTATTPTATTPTPTPTVGKSIYVGGRPEAIVIAPPRR
jgi:hyaluronoglucosaminidase